MKIMLLGATGRTGKKVLNQLLARNHHVKVLARNEQSLPTHERLEWVKGHDLKELIARESFETVDAVVNVLNISRSNDFPWAPLRTPPTFLSDIMKVLIERMNTYGLRRLVVTSAWGANESLNDVPGWFRWIINHSNVGAAYRDHERQEHLLTATKLDWTIVRPVGLINATTIKPIEANSGGVRPPKLTISRVEVARFIVDILVQTQFFREVVTISRK